MKLAARSRIAITATVVAAGALLTPVTPAAAAGYCNWYDCDPITVYYSDASYTTIVGEQEQNLVCGDSSWGDQTVYVRYRYLHC